MIWITVGRLVRILYAQPHSRAVLPGKMIAVFFGILVLILMVPARAYPQSSPDTDSPCNPNPCLNDGICKEVLGGAECICTQCFIGPTCEFPTSAPPTNVTATAGCTGNSIAWTEACFTDSFDVLRGTTCGTTIDTFTNVTSPWNDATAAVGVTYQYWVVAWFEGSSADPSTCASASRPEGAQCVVPVPDGRIIAGLPMKGQSEANGYVYLTWDVATCQSQNYNVYWGSMGNYPALGGGFCAVGNNGSAWLQIPDNSWWVIAGTSGNALSSFGFDSGGNPQTFTGWQAICPAQTTQNNPATCP